MTKYNLSVKYEGDHGIRYFPIAINNYLHEDQNPNNLKTIVDFTTKFQNEEELEQFMIDNNDLFPDFLSPFRGCEYTISYLHGGQTHELPFGLPLSFDLPFLSAPAIKKQIIQAFNEYDQDLFVALKLFFANSLYEKRIIETVEILSRNIHNYPFENHGPSAEYIDELVRALIMKKNSKTKKYELSIRKVIDVGMLISSRKRRKIIAESTEKFSDENGTNISI